MPAPPARVEPGAFVELAQLYASHAVVEGPTGERYEPRTWSEIDVVQWLARQPGARGRSGSRAARSRRRSASGR